VCYRIHIILSEKRSIRQVRREVSSVDPYLQFFMPLILVCVVYAAITRVIHGSENVPTDNPVAQTAAENLDQAYRLACIRLRTDERRNLARFALALANTGPYWYGTPRLTNAVKHTHPLANTALRAGVIRMNLVFSARRLISTNKIPAKPPTDNEYARMVEVLSTDSNFLVVCVKYSDTLRAALRFLESPACDIEEFLPGVQSLTMRNVEVLEGINQELFRPLP
jgi:hypothetical protein